MELYLRKAVQEDCDLLFNWVNDKVVRQNSFNQQNILYEEHISWFNRIMNSDKCSIFILCFENNIPLGQIRINIKNKSAVISYSIDKNYRGKNLSIKMFSLLEKEVINSKSHIDKLIGYVKVENIISQNVFQKLKYTEICHEDFYEYYKLLPNKVVI